MRVISPATMGVPTTVLASTASRIRWMVSDMSSLTGWFFSMVCFPFPFRGGGGRLLLLPVFRDLAGQPVQIQVLGKILVDIGHYVIDLIVLDHILQTVSGSTK